jgi:hypothetical protein
MGKIIYVSRLFRWGEDGGAKTAKFTRNLLIMVARARTSYAVVAKVLELI